MLEKQAAKMARAYTEAFCKHFYSTVNYAVLTD
jgi:hypothetical protein